ncbi:MAG: putative Tyrosine--tRNA ligase 1 [Streblomastix strix]|uniref:tyrosine--tRNA ligase n=1 Tax=Streblomastix strix TaxID=222440 RepID=A0A5J4WL81_9EUKA|nr:MAG: putative Tyrosine--tRNA ligase 1 [Streblomastix strix]
MSTLGSSKENSVEERLQTILSIAAECVSEAELRALLESQKEIICYDGFEPSGRMHLAQAVLKAHIVRCLTGAGCKFVLWVADWFAKMNHKSGGDMKKIHRLGEYFIEVWKSLGIDNCDSVQILWARDEIGSNAAYWELVMDIAQTFTVKRITRCSQIMGRTDSDTLSGSQILYPCMQCADIFNLNADICQLGTDQRKVNMLAREYCEAKGRKKPIILSHNMLMGLSEGQAKMSKSNPMSAIFVDDEAELVREKIEKSFCPQDTTENSPLFNWIKFLILPVNGSLTIGERTYTTYESVQAAVDDKSFAWQYLKPSVSNVINAMLEPVRQHFKSTSELRQLKADVEAISAQSFQQKKQENAQEDQNIQEQQTEKS